MIMAESLVMEVLVRQNRATRKPPGYDVYQLLHTHQH